MALIAASAIAAVMTAGPLLSVIALGIARVQTVARAVVVFRRVQISWTRILAWFFTGFIAWAIVVELFAWEPMLTANPPSWPFVLAGAISLAACCWSELEERREARARRLRARYALDVAAIALLALLAIRTDGLFTTDRLGDDGASYHWGVAVGPAEVVRQGGWLLWGHAIAVRVPVHAAARGRADGYGLAIALSGQCCRHRNPRDLPVLRPARRSAQAAGIGDCPGGERGGRVSRFDLSPHALTGTLRPHVGRVLCHVREPPGGAWHRAMRQPVMKVMLNSQARGHCIARGGAPPDQSASVKTRRSSESWSAEDGMGS